MSETSSSSVPSIEPVRLSSTLSLNRLPSFLRHTLSNKIENLVEFTHVPDDVRIRETELPLVNPYSFFHRQRSFTRSIRTLISRTPPPVKEIVQSSRLDQCGLPATPAEQYVTLEIPQPLINSYIDQGYTHLHVGAIRLILTLHGRKGIPASARLALLDTAYKSYQNALIGTVLTTLSNGSVILTISPDFNIKLTDQTLSHRLKAQIQIVGAEQDEKATMATLHHQIIYRVQNHSLDLHLPNSTGDALYMFNDRDHGPAIINIPKQIPTEELTKIMPLEWINNYEKEFHSTPTDVHTVAPPIIQRMPDGTVKTIFQRPGTEGALPLRRIATLTPVYKSKEKPPVDHFTQQGRPVFVSHINGHFIWDLDPSMCDPGCECQDYDYWYDSDDEELINFSSKKKKSKPKSRTSCSSKYQYWHDKDDSHPPVTLQTRSTSPIPTIKERLKNLGHDSLVSDIFSSEQFPPLNCKPPIPISPPTLQPLPCIGMIRRPYEEEFPALEHRFNEHTKVSTKPYVIPSEVTPQGTYKQATPAEEVLNWQTDNAVSQNRFLHRIDTKLDSLTDKTEEIIQQVEGISGELQQLHLHLSQQAQQLEVDLKRYLEARYFGPEFSQKDRELSRIKAELKQMETALPKPRPYPSPPTLDLFSHIPSTSPLYAPPPETNYSDVFRSSHHLAKFLQHPDPPLETRSKKPPRRRPVSSAPAYSGPTYSFTRPSFQPPLKIHTPPTSPRPTPPNMPSSWKGKEVVTEPPPPSRTIATLNKFTTLDQEKEEDSSSLSPENTDSCMESISEDSQSTSNSELNYADISTIAMVDQRQTATEAEPSRSPIVEDPSTEEDMAESTPIAEPPTHTDQRNQRPSTGPWFTFDDVPPLGIRAAAMVMVVEEEDVAVVIDIRGNC